MDKTNAISPYYSNNNITLYHGDCQALIPQIEFTGMLVTDPPYGIGLSQSASTNIRKTAQSFTNIHGDDRPFDISAIFSWGYPQVIFGANNFPNILPFDPKKDGWICWDKRCSEAADRMVGSPFELALVRGKRTYKMIRLQHGGVIHADAWGQKRVHPTEKPVKLMSRILSFFPNLPVLDPFAGSGSTLLAACAEGRKAIGIELEERYCEIIAQRLHSMGYAG
jgi:DNA modification methylase